MPPRAVTSNSMTSAHAGFQPSPVARLQAPLGRWLRRIRAHPLLNPTALAEVSREWLGGYPPDPEHEPHLAAAIHWLGRGPDAPPGGGIFRALRLVRAPRSGERPGGEKRG